MVRNVKNEGMSFVEILVSMVILSIVVLVMTNVLVTSTRSHSSASSEDVGDMLALEKLAELQNHVIPAPERGETEKDTIIKDNQEYWRSWTMHATSNPPRVEVKVEWKDLADNEQQASVIGYIDDDNTCPEQTTPASNQPITGLKFMYTNAGTEEAIGVRAFTVPAGDALKAHSFVARLEPIDANLGVVVSGKTVDEDIISYALLGVNNDEDFYIKNDSIFTARNFPFGTSYSLDIKATDCGGTSVKEIIQVSVSISDFKVFFNKYEVDENYEGPIGKAFASKKVANWLEPTGDITVAANASDEQAGDLELNTKFDYENPAHRAQGFNVRATESGGTGDETVMCSLFVKNVEELPTGITLKKTTPGKVDNTESKGEIIDTLIITDPDGNVEHNYSVTVATQKMDGSTHTNLFASSRTHDGIYRLVTGVGVNTLKTFSGPFLAVITVTDHKVKGSNTHTESIQVNLAGLPHMSCADATEFQLKTSSTPGIPERPYSSNEKIWYSGIKYRCINPTDNETSPVGSADWEEIGICNAY